MDINILTLRRNHDNDAIIKSDSQEEVGGETRDKVLDGSIVINNYYGTCLM